MIMANGNVRFAVGIERAANSQLSGLFRLVKLALDAIELSMFYNALILSQATL
jgi:hypothetical protein